MTQWGRIGQDRGAPPLPEEIAFLRRFGVDETCLRTAAAVARSSGVTADRVLLSEGHLSAPLFYQLLADHLGLPYMRRPLRLGNEVRLDQATVIEIARLAPNPAGLDYVLAPRGTALALLLRQFATNPWPGEARVTITTPQRLAALVRLSHRGAIVQAASHSLPNWNARLSAHAGWNAGQILFGIATLALLAYLGWLAPESELLALSLLCSIIFLAMVSVRLAATACSPEIPTPRAARQPDDSLPIYTVVVPLYRESRVVRRLVAALSKLDYPAAKLDIKFVVEADDRDTLEALERQRLADRFEILIAPAGRPRTKPRALNVALQFATGAFLVVYDAEDDPEPSQLRVAVDHFDHADPRLGCFQARLAIDNAGDSWLSRLFALEYAALFDVVNPGLARLGLPIALGGTSNHFRVETLRRVNGWDAWNVTEDIDLGIRLARFGYRIGMLPSSTFEEAPHTLRAWLGQRRRWYKGWIITLQTHSHDPDRLYGDLGLVDCIVVAAVLCGTVVTSLLGPLFVAGLVLDAAFGFLLAPRTPFEIACSGFAGLLIAAGLASLAWPVILGARRRGLSGQGRWIALLPGYLMLVSVASWRALFEMTRNPYSWAKTEHGTAKRRCPPVAPSSPPLGAGKRRR